jgi:hypothetical protein
MQRVLEVFLLTNLKKKMEIMPFPKNNEGNRKNEQQWKKKGNQCFFQKKSVF